jgi:hypothetical protein
MGTTATCVEQQVPNDLMCFSYSDHVCWQGGGVFRNEQGCSVYQQYWTGPTGATCLTGSYFGTSVWTLSNGTTGVALSSPVGQQGPPVVYNCPNDGNLYMIPIDCPAITNLLFPSGCTAGQCVCLPPTYHCDHDYDCCSGVCNQTACK